MTTFDVIIIGAGPAGASAALYCARGGLSVAVVEHGGSALCRAEKIQNYYGTGEVTGRALYETGLRQIESVGATLVRAQATAVSFDGNLFCVSASGGELNCKRLVIATGSQRVSADIAGLKEAEGKGVSYCAVCDAFFYRKKRVGVLGAGEFALHEYSALENTAGEVVLFTDGEAPSFAAKSVYTQKILAAEIDDNGRLCGVKLADGTTVALDGLFVALGVMGSNAMARTLGIITDKSGIIKTDGAGKTNVPGLYAAGDCTAGVRQVAKAVCDGMNVAFDIIKDLKSGNGKTSA